MEKVKQRHGKSIAREHAVQGLYTYAMVNQLEMVMGDDKLAYEIATNVVNNHEELDVTIAKYLKKWTLLELNPVVLSILRLSVYEIKYDDTDNRIVINEALELAKKYADNNAKNFIHSVLDSVIKE